MEDPVECIKKCLDSLADIQIAVLYGSFATGKQTANSDVDLALGALQALPPDALVEIQTRLSLATGREVDLIDLNQAHGTVFRQALTTGTILFKKNDVLFAKILTRMVTEEADFEGIRRRVLDERRKRVLGEG